MPAQEILICVILPARAAEWTKPARDGTVFTQQVEHSLVIHFYKTLRSGIVKTVYNDRFVVKMTRDPQRLGR